MMFCCGRLLGGLMKEPILRGSHLKSFDLEVGSVIEPLQ